MGPGGILILGARRDAHPVWAYFIKPLFPNPRGWGGTWKAGGTRVRVGTRGAYLGMDGKACLPSLGAFGAPGFGRASGRGSRLTWVGAPENLPSPYNPNSTHLTTVYSRARLLS